MNAWTNVFAASNDSDFSVSQSVTDGIMIGLHQI